MHTETTVSKDIAAAMRERIVDDAILLGYSITLHAKGDIAILCSRDRTAILDAMTRSIEDRIILRDKGGRLAGSVLLVYGKGAEVVSDHTENEATDTVLAAAFAMGEAHQARQADALSGSALFPTGRVGWMTVEQYFRWSALRPGLMNVRKLQAVMDADYHVDPGLSGGSPAQKLARMYRALDAGIIFG
ncbi:hypothetical protein V5F40_22745 [Xanthobacter sp. DSM 14520]|uniref:hypothetical protein n=1 Tax=Xanthobacter autotrophicus (strain ATCC BAA-1158 / Py2) TaxID=78245 RepID=UPI00372A4A27